MNPEPAVEIEFQLVGSMLKDGKIISRIKDIVLPENFHSTICQDIYSAMLKTHEAGLTIDAVTVGDQLHRDGKLDSILHDVFSGRPAISHIRGLGNPRNAESYARDDNTPLCNLFVSLLQQMDVETDRFASGTGTLTGLDTQV